MERSINRREESKSGVGSRSSKAINKAEPIKVQDLDIKHVIDINTALTFMGMPMIFYTMLEQYEDMSLKKHMPLLAKELMDKNWDEYRNQAHAIKGPAGYVGAARLHYACYYIQKAHTEDDIQTMEDFYPLVVESAIEVRVHIRYIMAEYKNEPRPVISPEIEKVPIADGYRLAKQDGQYFCLKGNQSVEERKALYIQQLKKPSLFQGTQGAQAQNNNQNPQNNKSNFTGNRTTPDTKKKQRSDEYSNQPGQALQQRANNKPKGLSQQISNENDNQQQQPVGSNNNGGTSSIIPYQKIINEQSSNQPNDAKNAPEQLISMPPSNIPSKIMMSSDGQNSNRDMVMQHEKKLSGQDLVNQQQKQIVIVSESARLRVNQALQKINQIGIGNSNLNLSAVAVANKQQINPDMQQSNELTFGKEKPTEIIDNSSCVSSYCSENTIKSICLIF